MKKLIVIAFVACSAGRISFAGPASKEIIQQAPPPCEWYRAHEWDLDLWGTWALAGNTGLNDNRGQQFDGIRIPEGTGNPPGADDPQEHFDNGQYHNDRFIDRDDSWGGGADLKYFFSKYWGLGIQGFVINANDNAAGGAVGTLTIRWPIGCSRFAPYGWAGGGVAAGGSHSTWFFNETHHRRESNGQPVVVEREFNHPETVQNRHAEALGQFGAGMEVRITPRIGVMTDFAWNVLSAPDNNFGLLRFGATLSY
ncbi:MAG: hypothetical protein QOG48_5 [Verrucomicrobiota bacterium]|jgi:hypothetical protein